MYTALTKFGRAPVLHPQPRYATRKSTALQRPAAALACAIVAREIV
jgi:hypothetical protein